MKSSQPEVTNLLLSKLSARFFVSLIFKLCKFRLNLRASAIDSLISKEKIKRVKLSNLNVIWWRGLVKYLSWLMRFKWNSWRVVEKSPSSLKSSKRFPCHHFRIPPKLCKHLYEYSFTFQLCRRAQQFKWKTRKLNRNVMEELDRESQHSDERTCSVWNNMEKSSAGEVMRENGKHKSISYSLVCIWKPFKMEKLFKYCRKFLFLMPLLELEYPLSLPRFFFPPFEQEEKIHKLMLDEFLYNHKGLKTFVN